ncbi:DUF1801 domain-containing protein [Flagellimonas halotolerans]|uniref:DUF1801 domain-containing protein n=1 Tax=Flagellimonas halotolerans TaxID=3112164 RepID=A0ABU6IPG5_9FLAO|nr:MULTISPECIES: DUF1801 domain-containing protein [unclassified Allomuricauda]MEC3965231.1 DUF1801 domain-containing protein [Muricauda sp. SYSU M86414]MEC4264924.1 DUF1801 domain-containing protein [Muricauda sp. SYSU M84420]
MNPAEDYILNQPEPFKSILIQLQVLVETTVPELRLDFKYRLPFYYLNDRPFCYFNASRKKGHVDMCLWNSAHLTVHLDKLVTDGRKVMKSLRYFNMDEIDGKIVVELLREAKSVNHKGFYKS